MGEYRVLCSFVEILTNRGRYLISPAGRHSPSTTPVITACMPRSWKVEVCQKKKITTGRKNDHSAISSKEDVKYGATQTHFCQLRTNTIACTWRQTITATGSANTATTKHAILQMVFSGKKKKKKMRTMRCTGDECMPLTVFFREYYRLFLRPLRGSTRKYRDIGHLEPNHVRLEF